MEGGLEIILLGGILWSEGKPKSKEAYFSQVFVY